MLNWQISRITRSTTPSFPFSGLLTTYKVTPFWWRRALQFTLKWSESSKSWLVTKLGDVFQVATFCTSLCLPAEIPSVYLQPGLRGLTVGYCVIGAKLVCTIVSLWGTCHSHPTPDSQQWQLLFVEPAAVVFKWGHSHRCKTFLNKLQYILRLIIFMPSGVIFYIWWDHDQSAWKIHTAPRRFSDSSPPELRKQSDWLFFGTGLKKVDEK